MSRAKLATVAIAALAVGAAATPAYAHTAALTKAHAATIAKRINLRASDLPGYTAHPYQASASDKVAARKSAECAGFASAFSDTTSSAYGDSSTGVGYTSETEFVATRALAERDARRADSARARNCLKQELVAGSAAVGASDVTVTLTPVSESPVAGLDAIFGTHISVAFTVFGQPVHAYGYDFEFTRGNAEVSLDEIGTSDLSAAAARGPLPKLIARAKQQVPAAGLPTPR